MQSAINGASPHPSRACRLVIPKAGSRSTMDVGIPLFVIQHSRILDLIKHRGAMIFRGLDEGGQPAVLVVRDVRPEGKGVRSLIAITRGLQLFVSRIDRLLR